MPVAVGIYLPLVLSVPILIGGIVNLIVKKIAIQKQKSDVHLAKHATHRGILFSSGLIAGEAIVGILLAFFIVSGIRFPITIIDSSIVSLIAFAGVIWILVHIATRCATETKQ
jgi:uncharacterized oligopeptide transporter (OPT) family protein